MTQFLETLASLRVEEATPERLYAGDGTGRAARTVRSQTNAAYQVGLAEAIKLIGETLNGDRRARFYLQEAMSTSDFPLIFADVLDRMLLAYYLATPSIWRKCAKPRKVKDFRDVKSFAINGLGGRLPEVAQLGEYEAMSLDETKYQYRVKKHGARIPLSWELLLGDDMGAFLDIPQRFGEMAVWTQDYFYTGLHAGTTGPLGSLYTVGNANIINTTNGASGTNPALSIIGLQDGMTVFGNMKNDEGNPIVISAYILEVPPALEVVANNIINATQIIVGADSAAQRIQTNNWMARRVEVVVNPFLPIVSTTNGNSSWYLHASPTVGRPAFEFGQLAGHEGPEVFMKTPNSQRVGGGTVQEDFDTESVQYKVRDVHGGIAIDPKMTIASNGTGA